MNEHIANIRKNYLHILGQIDESTLAAINDLRNVHKQIQDLLLTYYLLPLRNCYEIRWKIIGNHPFIMCVFR